MNQEIEIEFKNIVTKVNFNRLCTAFYVEDSAFKIQVNHYFETEDFLLKKHGSALRIREKNDTYTLTLKQPNKIGLLETHQQITASEANLAVNNHSLPTGAVATQLYDSFSIKLTACGYLGSLTTERAEISYLGGTLVFDHSSYFDVEDFEIEYEACDEKIGREIFEALLSSHQIPIKKTDNKIKRFFTTMRKNGHNPPDPLPPSQKA